MPRLRRVDLSHQGSFRCTFDHITCLQTREPSNCAVELQRRTRRRPLSVEVRPARRSTCTHSPYRACPSAHFLRGGLLVPSLPCPSRHMHTTMEHHFAEGWGMRMTLLVYACECVSDMRVHDHRSSFAFTGCAVCTCPYREDATCMRRYLRAGASAKDSSGALMRAQTQSMRCAHSHGRCVRM